MRKSCSKDFNGADSFEINDKILNKFYYKLDEYQRDYYEAILDDSIKLAEERFLDKPVKEDERIIPYREAFLKLGINPNKFQCSVEAMFARISKAKGLPHINPLVNLNNAISLKYTLPMGTHDLSKSEEDIEMRFARPGDTFVPMGSLEVEYPDEGEVIYAVSNQVRTRRWTWRQSNEGKIDDKTNYVFFPIDGFVGFNDDNVRDAMKELENVLKSEFNCETISGFVDKDHPSFEW